jgi:hypothetical protein
MHNLIEIWIPKSKLHKVSDCCRGPKFLVTPEVTGLTTTTTCTWGRAYSSGCGWYTTPMRFHSRTFTGSSSSPLGIVHTPSVSTASG